MISPTPPNVENPTSVGFSTLGCRGAHPARNRVAAGCFPRPSNEETQDAPNRSILHPPYIVEPVQLNIFMPAAPQATSSTAMARIGVRRSFKKNTARSMPKITDVSRRAATRAMGARDMAQTDAP